MAFAVSYAAATQKMAQGLAQGQRAYFTATLRPSASESSESPESPESGPQHKRAYRARRGRRGRGMLINKE